jgi:hypothetical protein
LVNYEWFNRKRKWEGKNISMDDEQVESHWKATSSDSEAKRLHFIHYVGNQRLKFSSLCWIFLQGNEEKKIP